MKWSSNNRSINFLFKYKMNINYCIIKKATVKLKDCTTYKYCKNLYFYIIIVTIKELQFCNVCEILQAYY